MQERAVINRLLGSAGLATLDDPQAVCSQLGALVRSHEHFRSLLSHCDPEARSDMYNALAPNLRFTAKPLDVYISEAGDIADREQQTRWAGDHFEPYMQAEIKTTDEALVEEAVAKGHLELVCRKCTRTAVFSGVDQADAVQKARNDGWVVSTLGEGVIICPECP